MINKARENRIKELVSELGIREKAEIVSGNAVESKGIENAVTMPVGSGIQADPAGSAGQYFITYEEATVFPSPSVLACSFDDELVEDVAEAIGDEARNVDVNMVLGPSAAVKRSPLDGRDAERFSEDPRLTGNMASAYIRGLRKRGVEGCLTEYGVSHSEKERYTGDHRVDGDTFRDFYAEPFRIAIENAEPVAIRVADGMLNGTRQSENSFLLNDVLRSELGYTGAVVASRFNVNDRVKSLEAGVDYVAGNDPDLSRRLASAAKKQKKVNEALSKATERTLAMIMASTERSSIVLDSDYERHHSLARRAARESIVLLKNIEGMLPLNPDEKIAVIGSYAKNMPSVTIGLRGEEDCRKPSVLKELEKRGCSCAFSEGYNEDGSTNSAMIEKAVKTLSSAEKGIVILGLPHGAESEGYDKKSMALPDGILRLLDNLSNTGIPLIAVVCTGSPVELPFESKMKALLYVGLAGEASAEALSDVLLGSTNPSGKLAFTWPRSYRDLPFTSEDAHLMYCEGQNVGYRHCSDSGAEPLYHFGFGLSYSDVTYSDGRLDKVMVVSERAGTPISFRLKNNSDRPTAYTVQCYISLENGKNRRLAAYKKIRLMPEEVRLEEITVPADIFMIFDRETGRRHLVPGGYHIDLALSSRKEDILQSFGISVRSRYNLSQNDIADDSRSFTVSELIGVTGGKTDNYTDKLTMDSTLTELSERIAGRKIWEEFLEVSYDENRPFKEEWFESIIHMPIRNLEILSRGSVTYRHVRNIVNLSNGRLIRSIIDVF